MGTLDEVAGPRLQSAAKLIRRPLQLAKCPETERDRWEIGRHEIDSI